MANPQIKIKRSSVAGKIPTADQLPLGELAVNTYDGKLFASKNVGIGTTVFTVNPWTAGVGTNTYNTYFTEGNVGIGNTLPTSKLSVTGNASISGILTADQVYTSNNGNGTNIRIGDDLWIGDINLSNTTRFSGAQDSTKAFIVFGNSDTVALGRTASGSLYYGGDFTVAGVITATTFSGQINAGVGTITNLLGTNLNYSGVGTVGSLNIGATQVISSARQLQNIASLDATTTATIESAIANAPNTFTDLRVTGFSTLSATSATSINVSGLSTFSGYVSAGTTVGIGTIIRIVPYDTLNSGTLAFEGSAGQLLSITNNLTSGSIFSVNDVSGIPSIDVNADGTISLGVFGGNIGVGTTAPTSKLTVLGDARVSGVGTIVTLNGTTVSYTTGNFTTGNVVTGVITNAQGTNLNYSGIGTITTFNATSSSVTNRTGTNLNISGIATVGSLNIGATQVISSGRQLQNIASLDATTTATIESAIAAAPNNFNDLNVTGISTFTNGPVLIGSGTSTGTVSQRLQVTGGGYVSGNLGVGSANPSSLLTVQGDVLIVGLATANSFRARGGSPGGLGANNNGYGFFGSGDNDSGMYSSADGQVEFYSNSQEAARFTSNQNFLIGSITETGTASQKLQVTSGAYFSGSVGIGTTNPQYKTHIVGSSDILAIESTSASDRTTIKLLTNGNDWEVGARGSASNPANSFYIYDNAASQYRQVIDVSGNVLVGGAATSTGTASQPLQVTGGAYVSGNLGLGNTLPTSKLSVTGDGNFSGVVTATTFNGQVNAGIGTITTLNTTNSSATNRTGTNLNITGIGTVNSLNIGATQVISSGRQLQNIASLDATTTATIESAIAAAPNNFNDLNVTGISTFTNGPVFIGSGTSTGTASQPLQVTGGAYVSGNLGIGTANPGDALTVSGKIQLLQNSGSLNRIIFRGQPSSLFRWSIDNNGSVNDFRIFKEDDATAANGVVYLGISTGGNVTATTFSGTTVNATTGNVVTGIITNAQGTNLNYSGISTLGSVLSGNINSSGVVTATSFVGSGANLTSLNATQLTSGTVPGARITSSGGDFTVGNNLFVNGVLSVGGTSIILNAAQLKINDRDITLGVTTDALGNDISNDNTANHGGIAIASTVGTPIINIPTDVVNNDLTTYKQIMWIKQGHYSGLGTDAWVLNYGVSIGNTATVQNGSRLTVGAGFTVYENYNDLQSLRSVNINNSGITTLSGGLNASQGADLARLRVTGITTLGQVNVTGLSNAGVSTLGNAIADTLVVTGFSSLGATSGSLLSISGISTLSGGVSATQGIDAARLRVTGITTLGQANITGLSNAGVSTLGNATASTLNVSGVSTLSTISLSAADVTSTTTTTTTIAATSIASISTSTYRSAVFQIQAVQATNYNMTTINVLHDGVETYMTEYGTINQPVGIATYSTDINAGSLRLLAYPASINSTVFRVIITALDL